MIERGGKTREGIFLIFIALLLLARFFHINTFIEEPHAWRQCDTAFYIWDFYSNSMNILRPDVCWNGYASTIALEFPFPEWVIAGLYKIFGPHLWIARSVILLFFVMSLYYLFRIVEHLTGNKDQAYLSAVFYCAAPLGMYYSRAVHVDFVALAFSHAAVYYLLVGISNPDKRLLSLLAGTLTAAMAALIKIPYLFYMALPLIWYAWYWHRTWLFSFKYLFPCSILPLVLFGLWRLHTYELNSAVPDWDFIPGYMKFINMGDWYFGPLSQRFEVDNWVKLYNVLFKEITRFTGGVFVCTGIMVLLLQSNTVIKKFWLWWGMGVLVYLLIFFNLNKIHHYYQIPFIPFLAVPAGIGIYRLASCFRRKKWYFATITAIFVLLSAENTIYAEEHYYRIKPFQVEAGEVIRANTEKGDLVVVSAPDYSTRNPEYLYRARRKGWPLQLKYLNQKRLQKFHELGAKYVFVVHNKPLKNPYLQRSDAELIVNDTLIKKWKIKGYKLRSLPK